MKKRLGEAYYAMRCLSINGILEAFVVLIRKPQIQADEEEIVFQEPRGRVHEVLDGTKGRLPNGFLRLCYKTATFSSHIVTSRFEEYAATPSYCRICSSLHLRS